MERAIVAVVNLTRSPFTGSRTVISAHSDRPSEYICALVDGITDKVCPSGDRRPAVGGDRAAETECLNIGRGQYTLQPNARRDP